jgi:hypothetical protein
MSAVKRAAPDRLWSPSSDPPPAPLENKSAARVDHVGIWGYRRDTLARDLGASPNNETSMAEQLLQRGDVVACAGRYFVVWTSSRGSIEAFPILLGVEATLACHVVVAGTELAAWRVTELFAAVSVTETETLDALPALRIIRVGRCSGGLICRVVGAAARAYARRNPGPVRRGELDNNQADTALLAAAQLDRSAADP